MQPTTGLRPWDRAEKSKTSTLPPRPVPAKPSKPEETATQPAPAEPAPAYTPTVTRMDTVHPATIVQSDLIGRTVRVRRIKRAVAIAVWLAIIAVVVLILFVGSQPAPPDFESLGRFIA
ncbi:MAG: hypothetical protein GY778_01120 [bacterium]|nr:hypothetical protein [bacterium]